MLEKALKGSRTYWCWVGLLGAIIFVGFLCWLTQIDEGLGITGMSRDVTWGFYIAQFTFLVGVAASAVMVVLPYYLHDYKAFGKLTVLGEFFAVGAVLMCLLFIMADLGQPQRGMNIIFHPSPNSILFWDMIVLNGYLVINMVLSWVALSSERSGVKPSGWWIKPMVYLSIPWAVSIHTVTAFIYCGLPGRSFWLTAILAPRFLASAFASGPALLILLCFVMRKFTKFDAGREPVQKLALIATYAMLLNVFFMLLEVFTAIYSGIPEHAHHFEYLFLGLGGHNKLVPWMWLSQIFAVIAIILLVVPRFRHNENKLFWACIFVFAAIWIDKGLGMVVAGFVPNPMEHITEYWPTLRELLISMGIYSLGILVITVLFKVALTVRGKVSA
ncbi:MAG: polysulfide reductase NrfD [Planctomycetes bacterium]|nr:polysulfide reductase NrfD [Planctomycetota bacterium]